MIRALRARRPRAEPDPVSRDTMRLVTFSDGVFAITITLLIVKIKPPSDDKNLLHGLVAPVLGVTVIVAFNAFYWFPIRGESPPREPEQTPT